MVNQLDEIDKTLGKTDRLLDEIKKSPQGLAESINSKTSKLRDTIFSLENTVEETEGIEIEDLKVSQAVISELREMKDKTRSLDISTKGYLKILSLIENNGHKLDNELTETAENLKIGLFNVKEKSSEVQSSLEKLLEKLIDVAIEAEDLSRKKII
jgi:Rad3-related DNA helicase